MRTGSPYAPRPHAAIAGRGDTRATWHRAVRTLTGDAPAVFLYAPSSPMALHTRFEQVTVNPDSYWSSIWRWRIRRGQELPRDRTP